MSGLSPGLAARRAFGLCLLGAAVFWAAVPARLAPDDAFIDVSGYGKQMRMAIRDYENGNDLAAMDRFMDVLVNGDPSERPMANDYLNRITQRMSNIGEVRRQAPQAAVIESYGKQTPRSPVSPGQVQERPEGPPSQEDLRPRMTEGELSSSDRTVMKREIEAKIQNQARLSVDKLKRYEDIRVQMATSRAPRAIAIPADLLFDDGIQFKRDAGKILDILTELVFNLGATQVAILPEGAIIGNAKILDMRRTMGISSHLYKAGLAPSRIRVNLLPTQVDVPREMQDFRGILLIFLYNQPLHLASQSALDERGGPPVSLGAWPPSIDPRNGEGTIIEFSVIEPPPGLMSWRFQLLGPGERRGEDFVTLQEVKGSAPVFHQIYWNGRKSYFGQPYPPGQYEAVLSATDLKNRARKKHLWVTLEGAPRPKPPKPETPLVAKAVKPKPEAQPSDLPSVEEQQGESEEEEEAAVKAAAKAVSDAKPKRAQPPAQKKGKQPKTQKKPEAELGPKVEAEETVEKPAKPEEPAEKPAKPEGTAEKPTSKKGVEIGGSKPGATESAKSGAAAKPADPDQPQHPGVVNFQVAFVRNSVNMAQDSEPVLGHVADTMELYPLDKINLVGYAFSGEADAAGLAQKRADFVKRRLVEQYRMKAEMIQTQTQVTDNESFRVEVYIVRGR
ncbi:MAG: hypothetical protein HY922_02810 [Elusimicrobia bacterium]|nr:hypothetical protein [Elusimicrobiota bacterium]